MYNIIGIIGKSGSGKNYIYQKIIEKCGNDINPIVADTTRPRRENEIDGVIALTYIYNEKNKKLSDYLPYFIQCGKGIFLHELKDKYMDTYGNI